MATGPTGDTDERLAGLGSSLRELQGKIEILRRSVADLNPSSIPAPAPPEPPPSRSRRPPASERRAPEPAELPDSGPSPEPAPAEPVPEGDELVARLRGLLDELREITQSALPRSEPPATRTSRPGASGAARRSRR